MKAVLIVLALFMLGCAHARTDKVVGAHPEPTPIRFSTQTGPLQIVVIGLVHGHAEGLLWNAANRDDIDLVGIYEPNKALFDRLAQKYGIDPSLRYDDVALMLEETQPEAASIMNSIAGHAEAVELCAAQGVHSLVEKPLAFSTEDARRMKAASWRFGALVLTNYETSWYASLREAKRLVDNGELSLIRRMVFRHGHPGPREIGCAEEFLEWLTDPQENGGGALVDFGCYGIALSIWLMDGKKPTSITATTSTLKPNVYPHVDDDATIVLGFEGATAVVQASWAWTHDNKEADIHTETGSLHAGKWNTLSRRAPNEQPLTVEPRPLGEMYQNEWTYLRHVIRGECEVDPLSSLDLNVTVSEIIDEARRQARAGGGQ
ncbi:MAG: hypothetical protein Phyf2KO_25080 [Phycisphaerales bacterium]